MAEDTAEHWDTVYTDKASTDTSWYQPRAETSLRLLAVAVPGSVVDVGAGTSTLADDLLAAGWAPVTVLDVSAAALEQTRRRLAPDADVRFVVTDLLQWRPDAGSFDAWHDRAVFHFLTRPEHQAQYVATAARAVRSGGVLVIGTFGPNGPEQCSGLSVARHDVASIAAHFAPHFEVVADEEESHHTPWGAEQRFTWVTLRRS